MSGEQRTWKGVRPRRNLICLYAIPYLRHRDISHVSTSNKVMLLQQAAAPPRSKMSRCSVSRTTAPSHLPRCVGTSSVSSWKSTMPGYPSISKQAAKPSDKCFRINKPDSAGDQLNWHVQIPFVSWTSVQVYGSGSGEVRRSHLILTDAPDNSFDSQPLQTKAQHKAPDFWKDVPREVGKRYLGRQPGCAFGHLTGSAAGCVPYRDLN